MLVSKKSKRFDFDLEDYLYWEAINRDAIDEGRPERKPLPKDWPEIKARLREKANEVRQLRELEEDDKKRKESENK